MSWQPTDQQIADIKEVLSIYGQQSDNSISTKMLGAALRALKLNPLEREIMDFITEFDREGTGVISYDNLLKIYGRKKRDSDTVEELLEAFRVFDQAGTGHIPMPEFRYYMVRLGEQLPEEEVDEILKIAADPDNADRVNITKFAKYLMGIKED
jgi:calmodulin